MLELYLISDVHLDHYKPYEFPKPPKLIHTFEDSKEDARVLVVAGDVATFTQRTQAIWYLAQLAKEFTHVLFVLGTHDFYGGSVPMVKSWWRDVAPTLLPENVQVLQERFFHVGDVVFAGTTMWTDASDATPDQTRMMNDFRLIFGATPKSLLQEHRVALKFLLRCAKGKHKVVITHHLPFDKSIAEEWKGSVLNKFFSASLDAETMATGTHLWLHGHTHSPCDYMATKRTRVVCNPRGYPSEQ